MGGVEVKPIDITRGALDWCGAKDRETFKSDEDYFKNNWHALPGLRSYVERAANRRIHDEGLSRTELATLRRQLADAEAKLAVAREALLLWRDSSLMSEYDENGGRADLPDGLCAHAGGDVEMAVKATRTALATIGEQP